jgi:RND superfamily putative drug exporter
MELLGDRNWWLPRWLDRLLPVVHVDAVDDDRGAHPERAGSRDGATDGAAAAERQTVG